MKNKRSLSVIVLIISFFVLTACFCIVVGINDRYNKTPITVDFKASDFNDRFFSTKELTIEVGIREGDSATWFRDAVYDDDGNELSTNGIGTIYEIELSNNTDQTIESWSMKVDIPEKMQMNNTWNGLFEIHQRADDGTDVSQTLSLADYSDYDIILKHHMENVGPMVYLNEGDHFIYYPSPLFGEVPIVPSDLEKNEIAHTKFGFIMYMYEKPMDYITDFRSGSLTYQMHRDILQLSVFRILCVCAVIWFAFLMSTIIVKIKMKKILIQREHDEEIIEQTMNTFVNFIEAKDPNTMGHSVRVAGYTKMIARELGFSDEECRRFYYIALMHDCGKIFIPDEILTKPARLTDDEYTIMKSHTIRGKEMLRDFNSITDIEYGALYHHERFDGKGYPNGISGKEIPLIARIIGICDAFDAMNSTRCYRDYLTKDYILSELEKNRDKQFDSEMVDILLKLIEKGEISFQNEK